MDHSEKEHTTTTTTTTTIIGFLGILAILVAFYLIVRETYIFLNKTESDLAIAIIVASISGIVSIITILLTKYFEKKEELKKELRLQKVPIYEELVSFLFKMLLGEKTGNKVSDQEVIIFFSQFTPKLISWSSDKVLLTFTNYRSDLIKYADSSEKDPSKILLDYENLLLTIREDLGHENKNIKETDILRLFINDIP